jgi:hypothetical protein
VKLKSPGEEAGIVPPKRFNKPIIRMCFRNQTFAQPFHAL